MSDTKRDWVSYAMDGHVVVSIGQLSKADSRSLDAAVRRGDLVKWRGHWFPLTGHPSYGMGPLKTCYSNVNPWCKGGSFSL